MSASQRTNVLTQDLIKSIWKYSNGDLYWLEKRPGISINKKAGCLDISNGYVYIGYMYKRYPVHNLIWIMHNGDIPDNLEVDHIDYNRSNNVLSNLQLLSTQDNLLLRQHIVQPRGSIYFQKPNNKWRVQIIYESKRIEIGLFETHEKAVNALNLHRASLGFDPIVHKSLDKLTKAGVAAPVVDTEAQPA
jgi:hypothetical protein